MNTIKTIDCNYVYPEIACAFLLVDGSSALFVENNTSKAANILLKELENSNIPKENVEYLIITHVHLDHASGTSALLKSCPNAKVLAHPKAAPHIINPKRLIESATMVYGEEAFKELYGVIEPVSEEKVRIIEDEEVISFGSRKLKFFYTKGHANHHFVIFDSETNGIFTGDSFGIAYPSLQLGNYPFLFPSTTPTDFDPDEAILTVDKIINTGADKAYLTHFGVWNQMGEGASQLKSGLLVMKNILEEAVESELSDDKIEGICLQRVNEFFKKEIHKRNLELSNEQWNILKLDIKINAMGIAYSAKRKRKKR